LNQWFPQDLDVIDDIFINADKLDGKAKGGIWHGTLCIGLARYFKKQGWIKGYFDFESVAQMISYISNYAPALVGFALPTVWMPSMSRGWVTMGSDTNTGTFHSLLIYGVDPDAEVMHPNEHGEYVATGERGAFKAMNHFYADGAAGCANRVWIAFSEVERLLTDRRNEAMGVLVEKPALYRRAVNWLREKL
jgi:hypothetical protein